MLSRPYMAITITNIKGVHDDIRTRIKTGIM
jgi:hypothetical protein